MQYTYRFEIQGSAAEMQGVYTILTPSLRRLTVVHCEKAARDIVDELNFLYRKA
jgi:hypothetical protein